MKTKIVTLTTADNKVYKISEDVLLACCPTLNDLFGTQQAEQTINLPKIQSQSFDYVFEFIQLHKSSAPLSLPPLVDPSVSLSKIMEEADAELIQRLTDSSKNTFLQVLNAALFLRMESFSSRLAQAGIINLFKETQNRPYLSEQNEEGLLADFCECIDNLKIFEGVL